MSARALAVLVILLVIIGGAALLYQRQQANERPQNAALLGKPLLKDLRAADVASIKIAEPKSALTLQRKDDGTYGAGDPGNFFFTTDGVMVETSLDYIISNEPIAIDVPRLGGK